MKVKVKILHAHDEIEVEQGTRLYDVAKEYQKDFASDIVLAVVNGKLKELFKSIKSDCEIEWLDISNRDGYRTYQRSLILLFIKATRDVYHDYNMHNIDVKVQFSLNRGMFCEILHVEEKPLDQEILDAIKMRMKSIIEQKMPILKSTMPTSDAIRLFYKQGMTDKKQLLKYRSASTTNIYELDGYYDYYYGYMVHNTAVLKNFDLFLHDTGVVVQLVSRKKPTEVASFDPDMTLYKTQIETTRWGEIMDVQTVGALNELISKGDFNQLLLVTEALMEKRIGAIADEIMKNKGKKKFVFIAGPSSSGKTTFAHRLAIQLATNGLKPRTISLDNYFVNREDTPLDEEGNYNFETIDAIDVAGFNKDMVNLLNGKEVDIPHFNFISGKREYKGNYMTLEENAILIVEGIHGLNPKMSYEIPEENKFKIYISALTQLNIDNHNRIPTTDARLLRRMVRDYQYRGASAKKTISMWPSVRRGEDMYIFPFQEEADVMFNSALIYEQSVLKQYALPLLFSVEATDKEYIEAKRLLKFLGYFLGVTTENIPNNSLLREFVGGSCFRT